MGFWSALKRFFGGGGNLMPEVQGQEDPGPLTMRESEILLERLHESNTRNEVMLRQVRREVEALEQRQAGLEDEIKRLPSDSFKVRLLLQDLDRLQTDKESKVRKADIYQGNLKRNNATIQNLDLAMATGERGVTSDEYARIQLDQREQLEAWRAEQVGDVRGERGQELIAERDRQRLAELEKRIIGTNTHFGPAQKAKTQRAPSDEELERMVGQESEIATQEAPKEERSQKARTESESA